MVTLVAHLAPMRAEVWGCAVPRVGPHPVTLTVNRIAEPLSAVTVALASDQRQVQQLAVALSSTARR